MSLKTFHEQINEATRRNTTRSKDDVADINPTVAAVVLRKSRRGNRDVIRPYKHGPVKFIVKNGERGEDV